MKRPYPSSMRTPDPSAKGGARRSHISTASRVSGSQLLLAGSGYIALALSGQLLSPTAFAAATSFYLLLNTVGRGVCAAIELHLTRAVAHDLSYGRGLRGARRAGLRQTAALLGLAVAVVLLGSPVINRVFRDDMLLTVLLAVSMPGMAYAYMQRGLLAGARQYGRYALSFATEGLTTLLLGGLLFTTRTGGTYSWVLAFVLGPLISVVVVWMVSARDRTSSDSATTHTAVAGFGDLGWSVVLQACAQGVWNLAPVILSWRLSESPEVAAGFTSLALILRIPMLVFPAAQAMLLPALTANTESARSHLQGLLPRLLGVGAVVVALWALVATVVAPVVVRVVFGQNSVPSTGVALLLAAASVVGGCAQLLQTALVARGGYRRSALGWAAALMVLVLLGILGPAIDLTAAASLAAASLVAALSFLPVRAGRLTAAAPGSGG